MAINWQGMLPNKENVLTSVAFGPSAAFGRRVVDTVAPKSVPNLFSSNEPEPQKTPFTPGPEIPPFTPYKGAFDDADKTKLQPEMQLGSKANWGSLIQGPDAFSGSGLAAQEAGTVRGADGMTPWEALLTQRQKGEQALASTDVGQMAQSQAEQAKSGLAAKGGLRAGSADRLDLGAQRQAQLDEQNVSRQGALGRLGIGAEAEKNRLGTLSNVSQSQQNVWDTTQRLQQNADAQNASNLLQANTFDINAILSEREAERASQREGYGQDINKWIGQVYSNALRK